MVTFLLRAAAGALAALLAVELVLRLLPVNTGLRNLPVSDSQPILRAEPNSRFTYSKGWNLRLVNEGHVNNDGFLADVDYAPGGRGVVVVGDSYVQGAAIPTDRNLAAQLRRRLHGTDVFALGVSGANLPDSVAAVRWAVPRYRPGAIVVVVTAGDVAGSFVARKGGYRFEADPAMSCAPQLNPWSPSGSWAVVLMKRLCIAYYLSENLRATEQWKAAFAPYTPPPAPGRLPASQASWRRASACFVEQIQAAAEGLPVLVVLHIRSQDDDRTPLLEALDAQRLPWIDLTPVFEARAHDFGTRLDFQPTDSHWNAQGHAVAAEAVAAWALPALGRSSVIPGPEASVVDSRADAARR
jgi:hypothetical protein